MQRQQEAVNVAAEPLMELSTQSRIITCSVLSTGLSIGLVTGALSTAAIGGIGTFFAPAIAATAGGTISVAVALGVGGAALLPLAPIYLTAAGLCGLLMSSLEQCKGNNSFANAICDSLIVVLQAIMGIGGLLVAPIAGAIIMGLPIIPVAICFAIGLLATIVATVVTAGILFGVGCLLTGDSIPPIHNTNIERMMGSISPAYSA